MIDTTIKPTYRFHLRQLWSYRELLENLIRRDIKAQVKQSILGYLWIFVPPLFTMGIFSMLFQGILGIKMTEDVPYIVYLACTIIPWQMFAGMIGMGAMALVSHGSLIKQVYFPKEVVILSVMSAEAFKTLIASAILIVLMAFYGISVGFNIFWVPILVFIQLLFTLGLILPLSMGNAFARDISKAIPLILSMWMYATPVVYPLEKIPEAYHGLYLLNPMASLIHNYRLVILKNTAPDLMSLFIAGIVSVIVFFIGYQIFKNAEGLLADVI